MPARVENRKTRDLRYLPLVFLPPALVSLEKAESRQHLVAATNFFRKTRPPVTRGTFSNVVPSRVGIVSILAFASLALRSLVSRTIFTIGDRSISLLFELQGVAGRYINLVTCVTRVVGEPHVLPH